MISNKIQIIYRLSNKLILMWPVRPNESNNTKPTSYNVYWDVSSVGAFATLLSSVDNMSCAEPFGNRSYKNKAVLTVITSQVPGWDDAVTNYVRLAAVIGGVEQAAEDVVTVPPYNTNGMRLVYPDLRTSAIIGFNKDENRFIPVSVDVDGKVQTV